MSFPATRLRRLRRSDRLRSLVRETRLDLEDFVFPLFVGPTSEANPELPALGRSAVEDLPAEAAELERLGVRAVMLFGIPDEKDAEGSGAWDDDGVVQRALRVLRERAPGLVLTTDARVVSDCQRRVGSFICLAPKALNNLYDRSVVPGTLESEQQQ